MGEERASVFDDDSQIDLEKLVGKGSTNKPPIDPEKVQEVASQSGFTSRQAKKRRVKRRSPYTVQANLKTRLGMKELLQDLSDRLDKYDQETFELALLALMEKEGMTDLIERYKEACEVTEKKKLPVNKPPPDDIKSVQLELFGQFVTNDQSEVSNTVELWESIPKYFFTP